MQMVGSAWQLPALLMLAVIDPSDIIVQADGNVGCLFSESLCIEDEWCYDDNAFGRCLPGFGSVVEEDLFRYDLDRETLHTLEREMGRLFALGYRWSHAYTQCELQAMLYAAKEGIDFDNTVCSHLEDQDLEGALKSLETEEQVDPQSMAYVKFTPSNGNPNADYADEVYFPQVLEGIESEHDLIPIDNGVENEDYVDEVERVIYPEIVKKTWIPAMHRRSVEHSSNNRKSTNSDLIQKQKLDEFEEILPFIAYLSSLNITPEEMQFLLRPENAEDLNYIMLNFFNQYEREMQQKLEREQMYQDLIKEENLAYLKQKFLNDLSENRYSRKYQMPERYKSDWQKTTQPLLDNTDTSDLYESRVYSEENDNENEPEFLHDETGSGEEQFHHEIFRELQNQKQNKNRYDYPNVPVYLRPMHEKPELEQEQERKSGVFTEGGVVYVPDRSRSRSRSLGTQFQFDDFLNDEHGWGFKRPERLDVKKPGPPFDEHTLLTSTEESVVQKNDFLDPKQEKDQFLDSVVKKEPRGAAGHPNPSTEQQFAVDTNYVYIGLKDGIRTWKQGSDIVLSISRLLQLDPWTLTHPRVARNEVTFRVEPNKQGLNASEVAKKIELIKDQIKKETGFEIITAGVGDKTKMPAVLNIENHSVAQMYLMIIILSGIFGTLLLAVVVLLLIRSQILSRKKLHNLTHPDTEASKDYQDLCRARMATKGQQQIIEKAEGLHGRITSLSRESEGSQHSPSSRSSTSSWSEEPTLTNMDISTGHMVLTYMEDHLKNKDRLEQEWVALCAYEAEPCSTAVALKPENVKKNRYMEILPYDHSRVVLNELTNMSGSDYINASSITDHDPRNPAYIATQGPLPHTAPDFWQMIWEQGSVVMVMLTRLTENGNAMCHRYWPEEGSEVYHIYEVHLVSEHIWCDDYLVRSFYLKNVKTGETRTVTQFHFLSWPENGIPTSTKALLEFRRKVNKSYRGRSCPIAVHCSDGAGRTGTYCLIDMVLNRMAKGAKEIDIAATLEHIRDQRHAMVATKQQFEFVLMAVAEEVHAILKALPAQLQQQQEKKDAENKEKEKQ